MKTKSITVKPRNQSKAREPGEERRAEHVSRGEPSRARAEQELREMCYGKADLGGFSTAPNRETQRGAHNSPPVTSPENREKTLWIAQVSPWTIINQIWVGGFFAFAIDSVCFFFGFFVFLVVFLVVFFSRFFVCFWVCLVCFFFLFFFFVCLFFFLFFLSLGVVVVVL